MHELLQHDTGLWVTFSFIIFVVVAYRLGKDTVLGKLDSRIESIGKEVAAAEALRVEAQELLAQYQRKQRDAEKEAKNIVARAKNHAENIKSQAEADLAESARRREEQLSARIKRMEENAIAEIRDHAARLATQATAEIILSNLDDKANAKLVDTAIGALPEDLN